jgi:hypothetical protein
MKITIKKATPAQISLITKLFNDCEFNSPQRRDYLFTRYGHRFSDELSVAQASEVIQDLIERANSLKTVSDPNPE